MMFSATVSEENSAPSWNSTPVARLQRLLGLAGHAARVHAEDLDPAVGAAD